MIKQLFNNTGEFMPNPILIGENPNAGVAPKAEPYLVAGNATPMWELVIDVAASSTKCARSSSGIHSRMSGDRLARCPAGTGKAV